MTDTRNDAVEWLESRDPYLIDKWVNPKRRLGEGAYTSFMADIKDDNCLEPWCSRCTSIYPQFITSLGWTAEDDEAWISYGDEGSWATRAELLDRLMRERAHAQALALNEAA
jgi:hypothetical protein